MKDNNQPKKRLNTKEVADLLQVSTATVYRLVERGYLTRHERPFGKTRVVYDADQVMTLRQQAMA